MNKSCSLTRKELAGFLKEQELGETFFELVSTAYFKTDQKVNHLCCKSMNAYV